MSDKQIRYGTLLYEVNSNEGNSVSLIESPGLFSFSTKYGNYKSPVTDRREDQRRALHAGITRRLNTSKSQILSLF